MTNPGNSNKIDQLKHLLLDEDLEHIDRIEEELHEFIQDYRVDERFEKRVLPIVESRINQFQRDIPEKMGPTITAALRRQVKDSQQEVVDALYPLIGKLIARYIRREIKALSARVDKQIDAIFSLEAWKRRIKAWFSGTSEAEMLLRDTLPPQLEEIYVIKKGSGTLLAKYSETEHINADMVAGLLTAIKSFSEDAFKKDKVELEMIEYESYKIQIFNIGSFYIAAVLSGVINNEFNEALESSVLDFVDKYTGIDKPDEIDGKNLSTHLKEHFNGFGN